MKREDYPRFLSEHKLILAPMAGVSDSVFRQLCIEQGASLAFTEMVSAKGLSFANERTSQLVDLGPVEDLVGVQLFGHEKETMADQARWVEQELGRHLAVIDINMGCPVRKIAGKGDGAALINDPRLAWEIISAVAQAVQVPVSVKTRRGFGPDRETCVEFARLAEDAGAAAVAIHGRYATQMYGGRADWDCIARTKDAVSIPVLGNGDVFCAQDALDLFSRTGCDAVLVARGAQGNPWLFAQIAQALENGEERHAADAYPDARQRVAMARRHAHMLYKLDPRALVRMRKHACWYLKGLPGASLAREHLNKASTIEDFDRILGELQSRFGEHGPRF